ncbi:uncharacterized protein LOC127005528 [Eriocheir sinensis]|uniref:uncharacterized protein LOC127005528 n=1 Tax=Eriocheir sinensis TaxID=95602 RepID=UPI0021C9F274|nr:uncharacterized protein LOC127005528 [Eriocheir sinensis]XP_050730409.1 uncharacterized protein LOC127005528 [Eriocheir sinensis]
MRLGVGQTGSLFILAHLTLLAADDRVTCCMGGWKVVRGVTLCGEPCCAGYEERQLKAPLLASPVLCHKLTEAEAKAKEEARQTTTTSTTTTTTARPSLLHPHLQFPPRPPPRPQSDPPVAPMLDQPRRFARAASQYRAFLYRHRHVFLGLLREGFSRKELMANLESFLNEISSMVYKPSVWYGA